MNGVKSIYKNIEKKWYNEALRKSTIDYLYLLILGVYLFFYFADTTMLQIRWQSDFLWVLRLSVLVVIIAKFLAKDKENDLISAIFIVSIIFIFIAVYHRTGYGILYDTAMLIVGAYNIEYKKILKLYLIISIPFTIYTIVLSQIGMVTNLIYNQHGRIRESFGFVYPTDFAAHVFFIFAAWVLIREVKCTIAELVIMLISIILLDKFCDTRCSEISILLLILLVIGLKIKDNLERKKKVAYKIPILLCMLVPVIAATSMTFLCRFYNPDNKLMGALNNILSQRLKLGKKIFDYYDIQLWGQYVAMTGNGGTTEKPADYTFIDCSYINILMRFGVIIFIIVLLILWLIMVRNSNNLCILGVLLIICINSVIEHHLLQFYYNILIILPLASFKAEYSPKHILFKFRKEEKNEKN